MAAARVKGAECKSVFIPITLNNLYHDFVFDKLGHVNDCKSKWKP